jgi:hypothetical protein
VAPVGLLASADERDSNLLLCHCSLPSVLSLSKGHRDEPCVGLATA